MLVRMQTNAVGGGGGNNKIEVDFTFTSINGTVNVPVTGLSKIETVVCIFPGINNTSVCLGCFNSDNAFIKASPDGVPSTFGVSGIDNANLEFSFTWNSSYQMDARVIGE